MTTVGIYCRLSLDRGEGSSVERQEAVCREFAERQGLEVAEVYTDSDLSAFKRGVVRPAYNRMVKDLKDRKIEGILVWKLDRLSRQPKQFEELLEEIDRMGGQRLWSVNDPDMTTPAGLAAVRIGMAFANMESQNTSLRLKAQREQAAKAGKPLGGPRPFGYSADGMAIVEAEAALIKEAAERILAGESLWSVGMDFKNRGVKGTRGTNPISTTQLRRILTRARNAGLREHKGAVYKAQWPAILDDHTYEAINSLLSVRKSGTRVSRNYLLAGLCYCGRCGHRMYGQRAETDERTVYRCFKVTGNDACGRLTIQARYLEPLIWDLLCERLKDVDLSAFIGSDKVDIITEIARLEASLEGLADDHYVKGTLPRTTYTNISRQLTEKMIALKEKLSAEDQKAFVAELNPGETLEEAWTTKPLLWKAQLLHAVIERIDIQPGKPGRFSPERIQIRWLM